MLEILDSVMYRYILHSDFWRGVGACGVLSSVLEAFNVQASRSKVIAFPIGDIVSLCVAIRHENNWEDKSWWYFPSGAIH